jgi:hypothetical protein
MPIADDGQACYYHYCHYHCHCHYFYSRCQPWQPVVAAVTHTADLAMLTTMMMTMMLMTMMLMMTMVHHSQD